MRRLTDGGRSPEPAETQTWRQGALAALLANETLAFPAAAGIWLAVRGGDRWTTWEWSCGC
jgi:hypothetical protein